MGVYEAMRAAGYAAGVMFTAALDSSRPRDQHRDYDRALRRAEDALVDAEAERDVLEPASNVHVRTLTVAEANAEISQLLDRAALPRDELERRGKAWELNATEREILSRVQSLEWLIGRTLDDVEDEAYDINADFDARKVERTNTWMRDKDSPVEGSGDATGGVPSPPSVVPLSELVDRVADELRAQHQPHWLGDKVRATAAMLKTQGL